jgi:YHS domain-containing protein
MGITNRDLEQAYAQHKEQYGGRKEDYFALLYLTREFDKSPDQVARHIAFGKDVTEGISAFHVDPNRRNLYLFQFQWSAQQQTLAGLIGSDPRTEPAAAIRPMGRLT